jgi:hypothetical protein
MAKDPDDRWSSAAEFVDRLGEALDAQPRRKAAPAATATTRKLGAERKPPPPPPPARPAAAAERPRSSGPGTGALLAALAAALLVVVLGFLLLKGNGDDKGNRASGTSTPKATATAKKKATPTATPKQTSTPEPTATSTPTQTPAPPAANGKKPKGSPAQLQLQAFNLNNAGKSAEALPYAQEAVKKGCKGNAPVSPCGYALYELARAQLATGDANGAVQSLQTRLDRYPDDQRPKVQALLDKAKKASG